MQRLYYHWCQSVMRTIVLFFLVTAMLACRRQTHCENATVFKSQRCGVEWEIEFNGDRYPAQNLADDLKRDGNRIEIYDSHFFTDPRMCPCCGYTWLVVDKAEDNLICL